MSRGLAPLCVRTGTKRKHPDEKNMVFIFFSQNETETGLMGADQGNAEYPKTTWMSVHGVILPANSNSKGDPDHKHGHRQRVKTRNQSNQSNKAEG